MGGELEWREDRVINCGNTPHLQHIHCLYSNNYTTDLRPISHLLHTNTNLISEGKGLLNYLICTCSDV